MIHILLFPYIFLIDTVISPAVFFQLVLLFSAILCLFSSFRDSVADCGIVRLALARGGRRPQAIPAEVLLVPTTKTTVPALVRVDVGTPVFSKELSGRGIFTYFRDF